MERKKICLALVITIPLVFTALSGCVGPWAVDTLGWDHMNLEGTSVRIWGQLTISENSENWREGFVWDTEFHQDWNDYAHRIDADEYAGLNTFAATIDGLDRFTEYHYRAFGEYLKGQGTIRLGVDNTFIPGGPRVTTYETTEYSPTSAILKAELWHMGGATEVTVFFEYGTDEQYFEDETDHITLSSTGVFTAEITNLESCTTYYYRAVARNDADTHVSWTLQVTPGQPNVATRLPTSVTGTTAVLEGELLHLGGTPTCNVWFIYGDQSPNNLDEQTPPQELTTPEEFEALVEGLQPQTTYWVRAVADNGICSIQGDIKEFKTGSLSQRIQQDKKTTSISPSQQIGLDPGVCQYLELLRNIDKEHVQEYLERCPTELHPILRLLFLK